VLSVKKMAAIAAIWRHCRSVRTSLSCRTRRRMKPSQTTLSWLVVCRQA